MKKLFAILLAALLLLNLGALAEGNAATLKASNVRIETMGQKMAVSDLDITLGLGNVNSLPSLALLINGGGENLFSALAQMTNQQLQFAVSGMDHGYCEPVPAEYLEQMAQIDPATMAQLMPMLIPGLNEVALPPFTGTDIPKVDLGDMLSKYITAQDAGSYNFEIPAEEVNQLLDQLLQIAKAQGTSNVDEAMQALEMMKQQNIGFVVRGHVVDDGSILSAAAGLFLSQNGSVGTEEFANLAITSSLNNFRADLAVSTGSTTNNVMTVTLVSDPAAAKLDFDMDIAGEADISFKLFPEDSLQKAEFRIAESGSDLADIVFAYGQQGGEDIVGLTVHSKEADFSFAINSTMGADNVRTGTMTLSLKDANNDVLVTADVEMRTDGQLDEGSLTIPADLRPFDQMDEAAMSEAFNAVAEYIQSHMQMG